MHESCLLMTVVTTKTKSEQSSVLFVFTMRVRRLIDPQGEGGEYITVCVCACVRACVRPCVRACLSARACVFFSDAHSLQACARCTEGEVDWQGLVCVSRRKLAGPSSTLAQVKLLMLLTCTDRVPNSIRERKNSERHFRHANLSPQR